MRNILAGNRVVREYRDVPPQQGYDQYDFVGRSTTARPCPVETVAEPGATKGVAFTEMVAASPVSAVQRLMAELLGAADEFRRLHISANDDDGDADGDNINDETTAGVSCVGGT